MVSSKGAAHVELETSRVRKLSIEVQQMTGESQAFFLDAMRSMLVEVKKDNGRSESGSAEGSAAAVGQRCSCRGKPRRGRTHCCRAESSRGRACYCTRDNFA